MKNNRVVVVEDDEWLAAHYLRILRRSGYEAYHSLHAAEAINVIDKVMPCAIVLDVLLAGTTALALMHELKSHTDLANIPIILATNLADQISIDDVVSYGVCQIIDKATMHPDDIINAVRRASV